MAILESDYCGIAWVHESLSWNFFPEALHVVSGEK